MNRIMGILVVSFFLIIAVVSFFTIDNKMVDMVYNAFNVDKLSNLQKVDYPILFKDMKMARATLNDEEKNIYDIIYSSIDSMKDEVDIPKTSYDNVERIYNYYINDSPEHFYIKDIVYRTRGNEVISIKFNYFYSRQDVDLKKQKISQEVNVVLNGAQSLTTDYEKSKYIHDYVLNKTFYNDDGKNSNYWIDGVFLNGEAVCQGYGKAYQYLANLIGIKSLYVRGYSRDVNHGWNLVELDGKYYYIDPTWNDIRVEDDQLEKPIDSIDYSYFHITEKELTKDHIIDYDKNPPLPVVDFSDLNYFVANNSIIYDYNKQKDFMIKEIQDALAKGDKSLVFKFDNADIYNRFSQDSEFLSNIMDTVVKRDFVKNIFNKKLNRYFTLSNNFMNTVNIVFE
ncbi:MAG: transglutaminase domain-containing protein [Oscillospiraceae bacterium]